MSTEPEKKSLPINVPSSSYEEPRTNFSYNARFLSEPSLYNGDLQIHSTLQLSSRCISSPKNIRMPNISNIDLSPTSQTASFIESTPAIMTSVNGAILPINSTDPSISNAINTTYMSHQDVSAISYGHFGKHFLLNASLFCSQSKSLTENFSPYTTFFNVADPKAQNSLSEGNINYQELHFKNSPVFKDDCNIRKQSYDSIQVTKKLNPYSIEELLKKPEKKTINFQPIKFHKTQIISNDLADPKKSIDIQSDSIVCLNSIDLNETQNLKNNRITIEVCDINV